MPRALALFAGTIGFVAAILLGMYGGDPPAGNLYRAAACGMALSVLTFLAGALGVQVVKESQAGEAASAAPAPSEGGGPPAAGGSATMESAKTAPPAAPGEAGVAGGARPRAAAKASAAPAPR